MEIRLTEPDSQHDALEPVDLVHPVDSRPSLLPTGVKVKDDGEGERGVCKIERGRKVRRVRRG